MFTIGYYKKKGTEIIRVVTTTVTTTTQVRVFKILLKISGGWPLNHSNLVRIMTSIPPVLLTIDSALLSLVLQALSLKRSSTLPVEAAEPLP